MCGVGFGAGFALVVCAVIGGCAWYSARPKPWDKTAITAEYDNVLPQGEDNDLTFNYVLQNNTTVDYRQQLEGAIDLTGKLKDKKEFSQFSGHYVTTEFPIFVPAKSRVRCSLKIPYPYPVKEKNNPTTDESKQYSTEVAKYVVEEMGNLDGFVLFDSANRYQINFPSGWEQRAKQTSSAQK